MMTAFASSPKVSVRSTLAKQNVVSADKRVDVVRLKHGELVPPGILSLVQKFLHRNSDFFSVSMDMVTLAFKDRLQVNGWTVDYRLIMKACIDSHGVENFVYSFYRNSGITFVTSGLLVKALSRAVQEEVSKNLQFVDVTHVVGPVKNAARHNSLVAAAKKLGIHLFTDELTLERVS